MKLLLDTRALLWAFAAPTELSLRAREAIVDGNNAVYASAVNAWEITIKKALGKLSAPDDYEAQLDEKRFFRLDITTEHALAVGDLPNVHRDPFDRLLVAQALVEKMTIVTCDSDIAQYGVNVIKA